MLLSICIPTYNRALNLYNCLHSIKIASKLVSKNKFEVCISDNSSNDDSKNIYKKFNKYLNLKYKKNKKNIGIPKNFINVTKMAKGEYIWLIGDDDLLLPNSLKKCIDLLDANKKVDFFYVNAFHLDVNYLKRFKKPFDTNNLPKNMLKFSNYNFSGTLPFFDLISPNISFDFLGGMFLSVFRKSKWEANLHSLDQLAINDKNIFSHFDNTFPHVKIFSKAFCNSVAYFNPKPLVVCLSGVREWTSKYPLVRSFRLVEALIEYRRNGLLLYQYFRCRNFALSHYIPDLVRMLINYKSSGVKNVNIFFWTLSNMIYPNLYLSPLIEIKKKIDKYIKK